MSDLFEIERQKTKERMKLDTQQAQVQNQQQENAMIQPEQERYKAAVKASKLKFLTPKNIATRKKDKLGTEFKPAITKESKRESKINNKKSALYAKQQVADRINYYEVGKTEELIQGGLADMGLYKELPAAFTDKKMAPEEKLKTQMKEIMTYDLSKLDMSTDVAFTNQLGVIDNIYEMNKIFKAQAGSSDFIGKMDKAEAEEYILKSAQIEALKNYSEARKTLLQDNYYMTHYNSELSANVKEGDADFDHLGVAQLLRNVQEAEEALSIAGKERYENYKLGVKIAEAAKAGYSHVKNGSKIPFFTPNRLQNYKIGDDDYKKLSKVWEQSIADNKWEKLGLKDEAVKKQFKEFYNTGINSYTECFAISAERTAIGEQIEALRAQIPVTEDMEAEIQRLQAYDAYLEEKAVRQQQKSDEMLVKFDTFMVENKMNIDGDQDKTEAINREYEDKLNDYKNDKSIFVVYNMTCENGETVQIEVINSLPLYLEGFKAKNKDAATAVVKELNELYLSQAVYSSLVEDNAESRKAKYYPDGKDNVRPKMANRELIPAMMHMHLNAVTTEIKSKLVELDKTGSGRFEGEQHNSAEYKNKANEIKAQKAELNKKAKKTQEDRNAINFLEEKWQYFINKSMALGDIEAMQNNNGIVEKFTEFGYEINEIESARLDKLL